MNILIATGIYPPDIGGPATFAKIASEELRKRGHQVTIVTYGSAAADNTVIVISRKLPKGIRHIAYFVAVLWHAKGKDTVLSLDPVSAGLPARFASLLLRKKFVIRVVGDYAWEQGMQRFGITDLLDIFLEKKYGLQVELLRRVQEWVARGADRVFVPSKYLKDVVVRWGVSADTIRIVPNSVNVPSSLNDPKSDDTLQLISVGRMVPWKGFEMLIELVPKLLQKAKIRLVIVGDGPQFPILKGLQDRLKLAGSVELPGIMPKEGLQRRMANSHIFLLNTAYEGFSHQIIEAMAAGVPVITTPLGGNRELVENGVNGILAEYNDTQEWEQKILELVGNADLRRRLAENGKKTARQFSVENMIDVLVGELETI